MHKLKYKKKHTRGPIFILLPLFFTIGNCTLILKFENNKVK